MLNHIAKIISHKMTRMDSELPHLDSLRELLVVRTCDNDTSAGVLYLRFASDGVLVLMDIYSGI